MTEPARPMGIVGISDEPAESRTSMLDALREDLAREIETDLIVLTVPGRPGYGVRFSTKVAYDDYARWTKRSEDRLNPSGVHLLRLGCIVIGNTCRGLVRNGEDVLDGGEPVTFSSPMLHEMLGVVDAAAAVRRFYGNDGHIITTGTEIIRAAGYADVIGEEQDPTKP